MSEKVPEEAFEYMLEADMSTIFPKWGTVYVKKEHRAYHSTYGNTSLRLLENGGCTSEEGEALLCLAIKRAIAVGGFFEGDVRYDLFEAYRNILKENDHTHPDREASVTVTRIIQEQKAPIAHAPTDATAQPNIFEETRGSASSMASIEGSTTLETRFS